jgi:catechol 2,3-dioxygenase-like lactoylglutathione lyase family enzyme
MRDFRDSKLMAKDLRAALAVRRIEISHSDALELVAKQHGFDNWNVLAAKLGAEEKAGEGEAYCFEPPIPVLRTFDEAKAREFYLDFLGFKFDWDHRFAPELPLYMQVSRGKVILHLSEHHGDASPGSTAFIWMNGIEVFHRELLAKKYKNSRPGLEKADWGLEFQVPDPFGNRIRFAQREKTG